MVRRRVMQAISPTSFQLLGNAITALDFRDRLTQQLELKTHALRLLQERVQGSESAQLAERVATIEKQLQDASQSLSAAKSKKAEMVAAAKVGLACSKSHRQRTYNGDREAKRSIRFTVDLYRGLL